MHFIVSKTVDGFYINSGDGNAITGITVDNANNKISVTKATCFAVAKSNNTSCIDNAGRADKADALNVSASGVGSATQGVYFNANGTPAKMTYCLGQNVTAGMKMICTITSPLSYDSVTQELSISINNSTGFSATDDSKPVTAKAIITYLKNRGISI